MWEIKLKNVRLPDGYRVMEDGDFVYLMNGKRTVEIYSSSLVSPLSAVIERDAFDDYYNKHSHRLYERNLRGDE